MVKISELLKYKEQIEAIEVKNLITSTNRVVEQIKHSMSFSEADRNTLAKLSLSSSIHTTQINKFVDNELVNIDNKIKNEIPKYLELSRNISPAFYSESIFQRIQHRIFDNNFEQFVIGLNKKYADYRYAGCELYPTTEDYTRSLVAFEPLYLIDHNANNLEIVCSRFNDQYRHKLRTYEVDLTTGISNLPKNTIGHISAVNIFERFSIEIITQILENLNNIMAPGCSLLLTYNNCDHWVGAELVEMGSACYQTNSLLQNMLDSLGFEDTKLHIFKNNMACVETKKSGNLTTIKRSSAIGRIMNINSLT